MAFAADQSLVDALLDDVLEHQPELLFSQAVSPEAGHGGVIGHLIIDSQAEKVLVGRVDACVLNYVAVQGSGCTGP